MRNLNNISRLFLLITIFGVGCSSPTPIAEDEPIETVTSDEEPIGDQAMAARAHSTINEVTHTVQSYFEADHYVSDGTTEPWYTADSDVDEQAGDHVRFEDKVFPGGTNIIVHNSTMIPQNKNIISSAPVLEGDADFDVEAVLEHSSFPTDEATYFVILTKPAPAPGWRPQRRSPPRPISIRKMSETTKYIFISKAPRKV